MSNSRENIANLLMYLGYATVIGIIIVLTLSWPTKLLDGTFDYSLHKFLTLTWIIALALILIGFVVKLWKNSIRWFLSHWKYFILFFTLIFTIILVDFIRIILISDINYKGAYIALILVSAFMLFLVSKYIEEQVQRKINKSSEK